MACGRVVVVGAGPCGLACARRLIALGHDDFVVLESAAHAGGLASSVVDPAGFTWDLGGHVVFSHYGEFDRLLDDAMGDDIEHHERSSYIRIAGTWVPYPLQNNLHRLPPELASEALIGLVTAQHSAQSAVHAAAEMDDFESWMLSKFGDGICAHFMKPYNEKVWAHPPAAMSSSWIAERVSVVDWREALRTIVSRRDNNDWGPNSLFAFPSAGGTGEIYRRAALPIADHITFESAVRSVDPDRKVVAAADGTEFAYDHLVWTGPLTELVTGLTTAPAAVNDAAGKLTHSSVTIVGMGYAEPVRDVGSWFYFPEPDVPFYRATNFGSYASANVPGGRADLYCSWMTEIASSPWRPLDEEDLVERVDAGLRRAGLVGPDTEIASAHVQHVVYGYPVPTLERDGALRVIQSWLMDRNILSRGRFGAWRYELGNMDHAVKMGSDVATKLVLGTDEAAWTM